MGCAAAAQLFEDDLPLSGIALEVRFGHENFFMINDPIINNKKVKTGCEKFRRIADTALQPVPLSLRERDGVRGDWENAEPAEQSQ